MLDFIGQHRNELRFEGLSQGPRRRLAWQVRRSGREGLSLPPSGCVLQLDAVVAKQVVDSLRRAVASAKAMAAAVQRPGDVSLRDYLEATGRDLDDVYNTGWSALRAQAGLDTVTDAEADMSRRLGALLHVDEPSRLRQWRAIPDVASLPLRDRRRLTMTEFQMVHRGVLRETEAAAEWLYESPRIRLELAELADVLEDRVALPDDRYPVADWPLALHRHCRRRESMAAVGYARPGAKGNPPQGGILMPKDEQRELRLVTLDKSASSFSPTTRYRDYAISPTLFHWETESAASVTRPSGRRYLESAENGWSFVLFVRADADAPYAFLGRVRYLRHEGDRPIGIKRSLKHAMPGALYDRFTMLAQGSGHARPTLRDSRFANNVSACSRLRISSSPFGWRSTLTATGATRTSRQPSA